ncbi:M23 family metallopeptidase [Demetria terragena]|uniref:M23 family metallopeptidase n=1 Tax=Demetria terragena TaxID=63959 RepID=UPI001461449B|nr:M23 family metallopeptidase [Demetria terragena]
MSTGMGAPGDDQRPLRDAHHMPLLMCTALLAALGGCAADPPRPPPLLQARPGLSRPLPTPAGQAVWPLQPTPRVVRPFDAPPQPWAAGHRGVDLLGRPSQPVRAALPGTITYSGVIAGRGVVSIGHADGSRTTYEPLQHRATKGTQVEAGDTIGTLTPAPSHCAPAACLHWGLLVGPDSYRDPLTLLGLRRPVILLPLTPP